MLLLLLPVSVELRVDETDGGDGIVQPHSLGWVFADQCGGEQVEHTTSHPRGDRSEFRTASHQREQ